MFNYRYCLISAFESGVKLHPLDQLKALEIHAIKAEPVPIADCWWFRTENKIDVLPKYIFEMKETFKFSDERQV